MNKKVLKIGAFTVLISLVVIAAVIAINVLAAKLPTKYTRFDLSGVDYYNISDETKEIIADVEDDIVLYLVASSDSVNGILEEFLERYSQLNSAINFEIIDPASNPTIAGNAGETHDLTKMEANSVLVLGEKRDREVPYSEIFFKEYTDEEYQEAYMYQMYYGTVPAELGTTKFGGEQAISSAIDYVASEYIPTIYMLGGHGESGFDETVSGYLSDDNYTVSELSLINGKGEIPEDATVICINSPKADISEAEMQILTSYVNNGGKLLLIHGINEGNMDVDFVNLHSLAESFGMKYEKGIVFDEVRYNSEPFYLLPNINTGDEITADFENKYVLMPLSLGFTVKDTQLGELTQLLTTDEKAYTVDAKNPEVEHIYEGQLTLGAVTRTQNGGCFAVYSCDMMLNPSYDQAVSGGNTELFLSTLANMSDKENSVSIAAKTMETNVLTMDEGTSNFWSLVLVGIIPIIFIVIGFGIWYSRRKR